MICSQYAEEREMEVNNAEGKKESTEKSAKVQENVNLKTEEHQRKNSCTKKNKKEQPQRKHKSWTSPKKVRE